MNPGRHSPYGGKPRGRSRLLVVGAAVVLGVVVGAGLGVVASGDGGSSAAVGPTTTSTAQPAASPAAAPIAVDRSAAATPGAPVVRDEAPEPADASNDDHSDDADSDDVAVGDEPSAVTTATGPLAPAPVVEAPPPLPAAEGLGDPAVTALRFATEYWTWRWDEADDGPLTRTRPYVTDRFAAGWAQSSSGAAAVALRRARLEVDTPTIDEVWEDPEQQGLWHVRGTRTTTADNNSAPQGRRIEATLIVVDRDGWRVDSVQAFR